MGGVPIFRIPRATLQLDVLHLQLIMNLRLTTSSSSQSPHHLVSLWKILGQQRQCWVLMTRLIKMIMKMTLRRRYCRWRWWKITQEPNPMVTSTHQLRKYFKTQWLQPNLWITIQVSLKPSLTGYEAKLKCLLLPMSSMFCCKYNKNYIIRMFVEGW